MGVGGSTYGPSASRGGASGTFTKVIDWTVPQDTGSADGDWCFPPIDPFHIEKGDNRSGLGGCQRFRQIWWHFESESGSGSNSWALRLYVVPNAADHSDDWLLFDPPAGPLGYVHPLTIDSADLPVDYLCSIPFWLADWTVKFTRSGGGTIDLNIRLEMDG